METLFLSLSLFQKENSFETLKRSLDKKLKCWPEKSILKPMTTPSNYWPAAEQFARVAKSSWNWKETQEIRRKSKL